ncbi:ethanolamine utilization protein EutH [Halobacillus naozhouensis]|uniref:Ethanolamine utilization protein EutH n=1 Tax=Halobacillus naozhouensis TaxID=554880 RepID=A0ABY8IZW0_9BACI|nr:ethanolamine utilization protein EutH [Halobacillus naozhouensis]WFT75765.1 ethanolamine utilization protein EutH [Halobacillus naozhouensis]
MWFNDGLLLIMTIFMVIGAVDYYILHNRWGLGQRFYDAFMMMGPLALAMVGIISLSPVLSAWLAPIITPVYQWLGVDPSMFASTILAIDMGAYQLAESLAESDDAAVFSWAFLGTMMGPTLVFTIPIALTMISKQDYPYFAKGILIGLITIPIGCLAGGAVAGYELWWMIRNLIPTVILAVCIGFGLWKFTHVTIKLFAQFGKAVELLIISGLVLIITETLTGISIVSGMAPIKEGIGIVGRITIMLAGAYPMVTFINQRGQRLWEKWSRKLGVNSLAMTGFIASLAHHIPMLATMKEMDTRGKVMNAAFAVSGAFVLGGHLGFVASVNKEMIFSVVIGKLVAGVLAGWIALLTTSPAEETNETFLENENGCKNDCYQKGDPINDC